MSASTLHLMTVVVGVGFEPTYATRADLQSAAFNHSATPPDCHFTPFSLSIANLRILRDKKAQLICQQRSRLMAPKNVKKHHSAKNPHRNRQKTNANRNLVRGRTDQNDTSKRSPSHHHEQISTFNNKTAPKPPQNGYFIWGRHAVFAALAEETIQNVRIQKNLCHSRKQETDELERVLGEPRLAAKTLSAAKASELPRAQVIDRDAPRCHWRETKSIKRVSEKAVHQGIAAAVWPLDPPHFDLFLDNIKSRLDQKIRRQ